MSQSIEITDLHVMRGRTHAVNGVTTSMQQGTITGLLGPSGAGKTSLLRAIVGVQKQSSGTISILGIPAGAPQLRTRMGYMTQSMGIYPDLSVRENVQYFGALHRVPSQRVDEVIDSVGLEGQRHQLANTLSGGQFSRTSLACALVSMPEILVLDEPTVGLDPVLREELWGHFRDYANQGATIIVSSHVMDEANRCDRLLLMRHGRVLADATVAELKQRTGTKDLDAAFLALVNEHDSAEDAA